MSANDRFERRLPAILDSLAPMRAPEYFDDILGQVDRTRQRPGWTFPERWLPVSAITNRLAVAPRVPMRPALAIILLILAVFVGTLLLAGSRQRVPPPFGPAANGLLAYADENGAIVSANLDGGAAKTIIPGPGNEHPVFSPDGTQLAYLRVNGGGTYDIVVAGADGSSPKVITTVPYLRIGHLGWSPDGSTVVAAALGSAELGSETRLLAFDLAKGGPPAVLTDRIPVVGSFVSLDGFNGGLADLFRPPAGNEFLFVGSGPSGDGIYRQAVSGGAPTAVLTTANTPIVFQDLWGAQWSPDGTQIAVTLLRPDDPNDWRVYVMNADGSDLRQLTSLATPGTIVVEQHPAWSPDGKQIALMRWFDHRSPAEGIEPRPITIVDVATGAEREVGTVETNDHPTGDDTSHGSLGWGWSPDGSSILETPGQGSPDIGRLLVVDAATGAVTRTRFTSSSAPSWQRKAP
jgi:Tol biopolymer transport system component